MNVQPDIDPDRLKTKSYAVCLSPKLDEELTRFAELAKISKSKLITNIVSTGIDILAIAERLAFLDLALTLRNFSNRIKEKIRTKKKSGIETTGARTITFTLPMIIYDQVEHFAQCADITPAKLIQNLLSFGVDELKAGEATYFLQTALLIEKFKETLGDKFWRFLGITRSREEMEKRMK